MSRSGSRAAHPTEWVREIAIRVVMVVLVVAVIASPSGALVPLGRGAVAALAALFLGGQILASVARLQLGAHWGIGVRPVDPAAPAYRAGTFRFLGHPMYTGTLFAALAQLLIVQNGAAVTLAASGCAVVAVKVLQEARWRRGPAPGALPARREP